MHLDSCEAIPTTKIYSPAQLTPQLLNLPEPHSRFAVNPWASLSSINHRPSWPERSHKRTSDLPWARGPVPRRKSRFGGSAVPDSIFRFIGEGFGPAVNTMFLPCFERFRVLSPIRPRWAAEPVCLELHGREARGLRRAFPLVHGSGSRVRFRFAAKGLLPRVCFGSPSLRYLVLMVGHCWLMDGKKRLPHFCAGRDCCPESQGIHISW